MKKILAMTLLSTIGAGCNRSGDGRFDAERAERAYVQAVEDCNAGRIDAALEGFKTAIRENPGNSSAMFQLAVLLQDGKNDYLGAVCAYRNYLLVAPSSDKSVIARERMALCAKLLYSEASKKAAAETEIAAELKTANAALEKQREENSALGKKLAELESKLATAEREAEKLKSVLKRMGEEDAPAARPAGERTPAAVSEAKELADAETAEADRPPPRVAIHDIEEDDGGVKLNPEALALFEEEEREAADGRSGPSALPPGMTASGTRLTDIGGRFGGGERQEFQSAQTGGQRVYTVQEGDTLMNIALKFYGRKKSWPRIQDANRATIPPDGSIRAGQTIVIP